MIFRVFIPLILSFFTIIVTIVLIDYRKTTMLSSIKRGGGGGVNNRLIKLSVSRNIERGKKYDKNEKKKYVITIRLRAGRPVTSEKKEKL